MHLPPNLEAVCLAAVRHNENAAYAAAGYPRLVPHIAEIGLGGRRDVMAFNVLVGESPLERLRAISQPARYRNAVIRIYER